MSETPETETSRAGEPAKSTAKTAPQTEPEQPASESSSKKSTKKPASEKRSAGRRPAFSAPGFDVARARSFVARLLWLICVLAALVLAVAALLIALDGNPENALVQFAVETADRVDLSVFDIRNPIIELDEAGMPPEEKVQTALLNYALAAVVWLVIGRILDRIVRP